MAVRKLDIEQLPDDPLEAIKAIYKHVEYLRGLLVDDKADIKELIPDFWEAVAILQGVLDLTPLGQDMTIQEFSPTPGENEAIAIQNAINFAKAANEECIRIQTEQQVARTREAVALRYKASFGYEFTDGDLQRIQQLINELREQLVANQQLTAEHKQRVMQRLEALQRELHKRVSDLSRIYGLVGEAGVLLGKLGEDAKPFVDRIREIAQIGWRTQSRAEELPSDLELPLLSASDKLESSSDN